MKNKDKGREAEEQMASNCCSRLESQKKSCLAGFRGYITEEPSLYPHSHSPLDEFTPNGFVDEGKLCAPLMKRLQGSAFPSVTQLLFMISISSSGKQGASLHVWGFLVAPHYTHTPFYSEKANKSLSLSLSLPPAIPPSLHPSLI